MGSVTLDRNGFTLNGKRQVLQVGSLFYFRIPRAAWRDRMEKMKLAGYHALDVYFPWNHHETAKGKWDFSGERDVDAFLSLAQEAGLYVVARPGPYICSEWDGGGLPAYLFAQDMRIRDNDPVYLQYVQTWFDRILPIIKKHSITDGGCIIAMQLENELDFFSDVHDRHGYIAALRHMAVKAGIDVPLICCAGQGGLDASGGLMPGVFPAMNFYPAADDSLFGRRALFYQQWLHGQGFPLMVTETNRDHQFLRLLLLLGTKLIGPYNQCGGTDFGFTTAVNNWGEPLSFQTSDYDFASMITPSGEYRRNMLLEARVLRSIIDAVPGITLAQPAPLPEGFQTPEGVFVTALSLPEGGMIAGGMVYGSQPAQAVWPEGGYPVIFEPGKCSFVMSHVPLKPLKVPGEITFASAVPVSLEKDRLVFAAEQPEACVVINGKRLAFDDEKTCNVDGITVTLLSVEEAAGLVLKETFGESFSVPLALSKVSDEDMFVALPAKPAQNGRLALEANGILKGYGLYEAQCRMDGVKGLLLTDAGDVITASLGGKALGVFSPEGHPLYLPVGNESGMQELHILAEIWGHCNFDDHRTPGMRIKSTRGVNTIAAISATTPIPLWQRTDEISGAAPQLTALGAWQTTQTPVSGTFSTLQPVLGSVRLIHFDGMMARADVFVNGRAAGTVDRFRPWLDVSGLNTDDGLLRIQCQVQKLDFCEPCGLPVLYQGEPVPGVTVRAIGERELQDALSSRADAGETFTFPLSFGDGQKMALHGIIPKGDCELALDGQEIKATVLRGGHICGRLVLDSAVLPPTKGGRPDTAYLPACWGDDLQIYLEPLNQNAQLTSIRFRTLGTFLP